MQMWSLFSLLALCFLDNYCQDPTTNLSPQKYVNAFAMAEALILTFMCMHVPSLRSLQAKVFFLRLTQSHQQPGGWEAKGFAPRTRCLASCRRVLVVCRAMAKKKKRFFFKKKVCQKTHRWFKLEPFLIQLSSMARTRTWFPPYN